MADTRTDEDWNSLSTPNEDWNTDSAGPENWLNDADVVMSDYFADRYFGGRYYAVRYFQGAAGAPVDPGLGASSPGVGGWIAPVLAVGA